MSFDLTDRGIKLLYRQRGSHLRKVDHNDDSLVINGPSSRRTSDDLIPATPNDELMEFQQEDDGINNFEELNYEPLNSEPADTQSWHHKEALDHVDSVEPVDHVDHVERVDHADGEQHYEANHDPYDELLNFYNFQELPLRQLSSSITSITSIDVLVSMFTNLFENDLISQALKKFEQADSPQLRMSYKLDVRIFETVLEQLVKDLQDILDINISNNELCYQLKQIVAVREDLSEQLVSTRKELQELKCGGQLYEVQKESQKISDRVELNEQLNNLTAKVAGLQEISDSVPVANVNEFCSNINPYNGTLARIQHINDKLHQKDE